jgi:dTDP-4-dehydrorhamnose reductase
MLGSDLVQQLRRMYEVTEVDIDDVDIRKAEMTELVIREKPGFVFHLAAYTQVDRAEEEREIAYAINVDGTRNIVDGCKRIDVPLLFISTDYLFDGEKDSPYRESDVPNPINVYGNTKHQAERIVMDELRKWFIVRTSWLFGRHGKNFVDTILGAAAKTDHLEVVDDQRGTPTYTRDLARALELFISDRGYGVYHVAGTGNCSWFDFAREIVSLSGSGTEVHAVTSDRMERPARRPANSVLDTAKFEEHFHYQMPAWQDALRRYLQEKGRV